MQIKNLKLSELKIEKKFILSYPIKPELYDNFRKKFPDFPQIIVNENNSIIFGHDLYHNLEKKGSKSIDVLKVQISEKDAIFLNYNLKAKFFGLNLYEKLFFLKNIKKRADINEVYEKTDLDINLNQELMDKMETILTDDFKNVLISDRISLKSALRLCDLDKDSRKQIIELFLKVPFSNSHQLKLIELIEEILFRDKSSVKNIYDKLNIEQYYALEKPQKKILESFFKHRHPVFTEYERKWREEIKGLKLDRSIKVFHHPFFEKGDFQLNISFKNQKNLIESIKKLKGLKKDK